MPVRSQVASPVRRRITDIVHPRWELAKLALRAGRSVTGAIIVTNVLLGLAPLVFVLTMSVVVGRIPAAIAADTDAPQWGELVVAFALAAGANLLQQLLTPVRAALGEVMARRIDGHVFNRLLRASLRTTDIATLEDQEALDQLAEARRELENASETPGQACAGQLALIARYVHLLSLVVAIGVGFSWWAAVVVFGSTMMFRYGQRGGLRKYSALLAGIAGNRRETDYLYELAVGARAGKEIRVYGLVRWLTARYRDATVRWMRPLWAARRRIYLKPFLVYTALGVLAIGSVLAAVGTSAGRDLSLTTTALVLQSVLAAVNLGVHYPESDVPTQLGINGYNALREFEAKVEASVAASTPAGPEATTQVPRAIGELRLENVRFHYPGQSRTVIDGLDLTIPAGRTTAIVGVNGAGKTTLVKLLTRLYEPTSGAVLADGTDIRRFPTDDWRRRIGVVFQDFLRYEASMADNIGFGAIDHIGDREGIARAARAAGLAPVIDRFPAGLDTPMARQMTGGADLSGGQWQRVAIARALFAVDHGASVLILDEPTASLDVRSEARFYREFVRLTRDVTTILISHRFSTVRQADNIVVLSDGRVLEQGSHDELLATDGRYAQLFRLQAMRFNDDDPSDELEGSV